MGATRHVGPHPDFATWVNKNVLSQDPVSHRTEQLQAHKPHRYGNAMTAKAYHVKVR